MPRVDARDERLRRRERLRWREGAVPRAAHENLAQHVGVAILARDLGIGLLILIDDQAVASGMHRQDGQIEIAAETDIAVEILHRARFGRDTRRAVKRIEVSLQVQPRMGIERLDLTIISRAFELGAVIDAGIPGWIASRASFEFGARVEGEEEVDLALPVILIDLLRGIILGRWLGSERREPAGNIGERGDERDACLALGGGLRGTEDGFRLAVDGVEGGRISD